MSAPLSTGSPQRGPAAPPPELPVERSAAEGFSQVVQALKKRMSAHAFRTYVQTARVVGADADSEQLRLGYSNEFILKQVQDTYLLLFEEELLRVLNRRVKVQLEVVEPAELGAASPPESGCAAPEPVKIAVPGRESRPGAEKGSSSPAAKEAVAPQGSVSALDSRYRFDTFIVGSSNQFVHAACEAVAERPGVTYNPLFIYGGPGLGKTHLMQAVGNQVVREHPAAVVRYTTSEKFTNDLIVAIGRHEMETFRKRYRDCDVLLIDDVQFFAGKRATEEEFFHTFNSLHAARKQIIVSSDRPAKDLDGIEERLRSRFQWGLIGDVQPPELETRSAILHSKAVEMRLELPDEVVAFLAEHIRRNVRELEGALTKIAAFSSLMKGPVTLDVCKDVLRSILHNGGEPVDSEQIIKECAEFFKVSVADIKGHVRTKHLARARQAAMYLSRKLTKESFPEIGRKFGGKDHSTVINAVQRVPKLMEEDPDFRKAVETLERELSSAL